MAHYSQHNRMRLAAGLAIDPKHEIAEAKKATDGIDQAKVAEMIAEALAADPRTAADIELDAAIVSVISEGTTCEGCKAIQEEDGEFQSAWKLQTQARHAHSSGKADMARGLAAAAALHMEKFNARKSDLKCDDCKNGVQNTPTNPQDGIVESAEALEEFVVGASNTPTSWEKDDKQPVNVVSDDDTLADRKEDKDESPEQLQALDTPSEQDQSGGGDMERKVAVPAKIKRLLRDEIKEAAAKAEKMDYSNREAAYFYKDLASMFQDLLNHIEGGTVYDIKKAQIFMTSLMGPLLHKIPADVVNFLARGGEPASLRSYMTKVDTTLINPNKLD